MFGCTSFVNDTNPNYEKLDPKATKCVPVGYSLIKKGTNATPQPKKKKENRMFVSLDTFLEDQNFYPTQPLHELTLGEERPWDHTVLFPIDPIFEPIPPTEKNLPIMPPTDLDAGGYPRELTNLNLNFMLCTKKQKTSRNTSFHSTTALPRVQPRGNSKTKTKLVDYGDRSDLETQSDNLDIFIALRKGLRTCIQHPFFNYLSYNRLSPTF